MNTLAKLLITVAILSGVIAVGTIVSLENGDMERALTRP